MYQCLHSDTIAREQMLMSESASSSMQCLPQSAVVIAMCSNYFKVANLNQLKIRIVSQPAQFRNMICVQHLKQPPIVKKFSKSIHLELALSITGTYYQHFLRERLRGQSVLALDAIHQYTHARIVHELQVHGQHHITN